MRSKHQKHPDKYKRFLKLVKQGLYKVHKNGRIYNTVTGNLIAQKQKSRYLQISFRDGDEQYTISAHILIWLVFKGPIPEGYEIDHKDGNKHNNRLSNLECVTCSVNNKRAYDSGLREGKGAKGTSNGSAKLNKSDVIKIRRLYKKGLSYHKVADKFDVTFATIRDIVKGRTWTHV